MELSQPTKNIALQILFRKVVKQTTTNLKEKEKIWFSDLPHYNIQYILFSKKTQHKHVIRHAEKQGSMASAGGTGWGGCVGGE